MAPSINKQMEIDFDSRQEAFYPKNYIFLYKYSLKERDLVMATVLRWLHSMTRFGASNSRQMSARGKSNSKADKKPWLISICSCSSKEILQRCGCAKCWRRAIRADSGLEEAQDARRKCFQHQQRSVGKSCGPRVGDTDRSDSPKPNASDWPLQSQYRQPHHGDEIRLSRQCSQFLGHRHHPLLFKCNNICVKAKGGPLLKQLNVLGTGRSLGETKRALATHRRLVL